MHLKQVKNFSRLLLCLLMAAALFAVVSPVSAQSPVYAEVDRTSLSAGETLTLSIVIAGSDVGVPELPMLDGFQVLSNSKSSQVSIINGVVSAQSSYEYVLVATREGMLTIPPVAVPIDGQVHYTQPITIEVTAGTAPLQPVQPVQPVNPAVPNPSTSQGLTGQDEYVEAFVDNPDPYVGEQVLYTFRFYRAIDYFGQPNYEAPSFSGFWTEGETQQHDYDIQAADRYYRVVELQTVLFPTSAGEHTIEPATLTIPGGFFSRPTHLVTEPITLNVIPTPEPAPQGFRGAVGQYSITTSVDNQQVAINDPLALRVVIAGEGNINTLPEPEMPILDGWRAFDATSNIQTGVQDGVFSGSRTIEQLFVPGVPGDFTIPAIHYTFFDPQSESYQTASTDPIFVNVSEGTGEPVVSQNPEDSNGTVIQQASDIRHIKPVPQALKSKTEPLVSSPYYWLFWFIPVGVLVFDVVWNRRKRYLASNPELVRASKAAKIAHRQLSQARREEANPYTAISSALNNYLSDRFGQPVTGMTQSSLKNLMVEKGVPPALVTRVSETLMWCDMGRFGAVDFQDDTILEMYRRTEEMLASLEERLNSLD